MRRISLFAALTVLMFPALTPAAPIISLVKSGTASTALDSIPVGTPTYSLDLRANTDNNPVGGLQYYIQTAPANAVKYSSSPVTVLNNPFTSADLASSPTSGAVVRQSGGRTAFFTFNPDYAAFNNNAIATYQLDTSSLAQGLYVFTPVGEELTNSSGTITTFGAPGTFSLTVTPAPEPAALGFLGVAGGVLLLRRRSNGRLWREAEEYLASKKTA